MNELKKIELIDLPEYISIYDELDGNSISG
jgi:hypothetical protein